MFMDIVLIGKCSEVWAFGNTISEGTSAEIANAQKQIKVIRYITEDLEEKA